MNAIICQIFIFTLAFASTMENKNASTTFPVSNKKGRIIKVRQRKESETSNFIKSNEFFNHREIIVYHFCPFLTTKEIYITRRICKSFGKFVQEYKETFLIHKKFNPEKNIVYFDNQTQIEKISENEILIKIPEELHNNYKTLSIQLNDVRDEFCTPFSLEFSKRPMELIQFYKNNNSMLRSKKNKTHDLSTTSTSNENEFKLIFDPPKNKILPHDSDFILKFKSVPQLNFYLGESKDISIKIGQENNEIIKIEQKLILKNKCRIFLREGFKLIIFLALFYVYVYILIIFSPF